MQHGADAAGPTTPWWRDAVIYQVYVRSFADSDGDGIGDLEGVRIHLDELVELGVDAIWLNPFYPSPQADAGYDVSDYCDVDPAFGSLEVFDRLLADAHALDLRVLIDLVPNHTSDRHDWFVAALADAPGGPDRARYLFRDGRGEQGEHAPNDWQSVFGGPAWTRVREPDGSPGQWYLHLFAPQQPDLDWTDERVRADFEQILRFWLDRGVDGFRIDVAHGLAKDPEMPDLSGRFETAGLARVGHPHWDRDEVHEVYRSWRRLADEYDDERVFVAEAYLSDPERLARYVRDDELHTAFNFRFLMAPWSAAALREVIASSIATHAAIGAPPTWVLANHDVVRVATRYGGGPEGLARARAAALLMLALPGVAYVYQGDELGLDEVEDLPPHVRQDPTFARTGGAEPGRDGCRVPLPWRDGPAFGFSPTGRSWLPQPDAWATVTRSAQEQDPASTLSLYRRAIALRRQLRPRLPATGLDWLELGPGVLAFTRGPQFVSITNTTTQPVGLGSLVHRAELSLSSADDDQPDSGAAPPSEVAADTTLWLTLTPSEHARAEGR